MTETASVLTVQTPENYMPNSVGRMIGGIDAKVVDENGKGTRYYYAIFMCGYNSTHNNNTSL
jgi:long-subunit acyl-CoA synthetase (AMP-forming)